MQNSTHFVWNRTIESDQENWPIMFDKIYLLNIVVTVVISLKLISGNFFFVLRGSGKCSCVALCNKMYITV